MNYFEFYELPVSFLLDEAVVKKKYLTLSKKYHPDFYINESEEKQREILQLSTLNTNAFQILSSFDKRMKYILELFGDLDEGKDKLSQSFLMEMMDINEELMELEFDADNSKLESIKHTIDAFENSLEEKVADSLKLFSEKDLNKDSDNLKVIKEYFLKKKYLLRIKDRLNKFALH